MSPSTRNIKTNPSNNEQAFNLYGRDEEIDENEYLADEPQRKPKTGKKLRKFPEGLDR